MALDNVGLHRSGLFRPPLLLDTPISLFGGLHCHQTLTGHPNAEMQR